MPSPTPTKYSGTGRCLAIAQSTPPLAVPSSLVSTRPVRPSASSKAFTCASPFCPVLASSTSSTSCGAPGSALPSTRFTFLISSIRCSCVGDQHVDRARARGGHRIEHHGGRVAALLRDDAHVVSLSPGGELLARR